MVHPSGPWKHSKIHAIIVLPLGFPGVQLSLLIGPGALISNIAKKILVITVT
jgi:hypothetical protein